jgi:hypothetical protein
MFLIAKTIQYTRIRAVFCDRGTDATVNQQSG